MPEWLGVLPRLGRRRTARAVPAAAAFTLALTASFGACAREIAPEGLIELGGPTMGASWSVKIVAHRAGLTTDARTELGRSIQAELDRLDVLMSTWKADSEISRFNRATSTEPFVISPQTFDVFELALEISRQTMGAMDVTVAPLVDAWGFGTGGEHAPPDEPTLTRLRSAVGFQLIDLDPERGWVRKRRPEVQCDFSALAPGYAADRIGSQLAARGFTDFLVDVGGELLARGRNDAGRPWQIAIERPVAAGRAVARMLPVSDLAVATSGDYRNFHEVNGERVTHILDPRTGRPLRHRLASVTVVADRAARADGLSTGLMVLGPEEGLRVAERLGIAALFLVSTPQGTLDARESSRFTALSAVRDGAE